MKTKYNRTYHLPFSPGNTSDDKIASSVSNLLNTRIVITEKVDGENTAMTSSGVYARSHAEFTKSGWSKEVRQIHSLVKDSIPENMFIFGENMEGIHSIEYLNLDSYFYVFGIRENNLWYSWDEVEDWCYLLDLKHVPILFEGIIETEKQLEEIVSSLVKGKSKLGGELEGIVIRKREQFFDSEFSLNVQKWVRENHVTTDEHWTRNWKKAKIKIF